MSSVRPNPPQTGSGGAKVDYNTLAVPANYVPGLGRGASGFTTRSDIGPARFVPKMQDQGDDKPAGKEEGDAPEEAKFDEFMGNDSGVLAGTPAQYDEEDKEADKVWEGIDNYMDERRREQRDERIRQQLEKYREENPKITEQFRDLKRKLADVADAEWEAIPEIGDYTIKKQTRMQSFAPTPDALLAGAAAANRVSATANDNGIMTPLSGLASVSGTASTVADLKAVGEGRGTVLSLKLDHVSDSVSGQTVVDPKGYLTDLKSMKISTATEISDIKKARLLLKSVVQSNQKHAPGWIAAARLEELAGDLPEARRLAMKGCEECPTSEDVWCEAARLQTADSAKAVLARAVAALPSSVKLWLQAARLEKDAAAKSRVLRKGLERIPASVRLWKAAVELANQDDARVLLSRAVECCPQHVELWLALARLETYEQARKVLNRARMAIPTERAVWITAVKLEEAQGNANRVPVIISRAIASLQTQGVVIDREAWLEEAKAAEKSQPPYTETCRAIIKDVIGMGVEDADRKRTWVSDAEECLRPRRGPKGQEGPWPETARAIYQHALQVFPLKKSIWRRAALLEKHHGSRESLFQLLDRATTCCPQAEVLWLMAAKEHWLANNVEAARGMLEKAYNANPGSEEILLAGFKLEFENGEPERARLILAKARSQDGGASTSERVWMKSAIVERELGDVDAERKLLNQGLQLFPDSAKLWLMLGQLEQRVRNPSAARTAFATGMARCWQSVPLWRCAAALEEQLGRVPKARAILDQARLKNPKTPELWLAAIRTEVRAGNAKEAQNVLARALQDCPSSGLLLAESVAMAPRHARKDRSAQALKRCNQDAHVFAAVAHHFWNDSKVDKARSWFDRAVTLNPDVGDFWAAFYKFECQYGTPESQAGIIERCKKEEPRHGERWCRVAKDPQNAHLATELILKKVVVDIDTQPPP